MCIGRRIRLCYITHAAICMLYAYRQSAVVHGISVLSANRFVWLHIVVIRLVD